MSKSVLQGNIVALRKLLGLNQADFGALMGSGQSDVSKWEARGNMPSPAPLARMADRAGVSVNSFLHHPWSPGNPSQAAPVARPVLSDTAPTIPANEGTVTIKLIDLGLSMGDGTNLDDYREEGTVEFDAAMFSAIARYAPAHRIFMAYGDGDSMTPTIINGDTVMIDTTQRELKSYDKIWACSINGGGAIKRLRPLADDQVEVVSDNDVVPNRVHHRDEIVLLGRVIWSGRRY